MSVFKTPEERRSYSLENPSNSLLSMFTGGERTISGRAMNDQRALSQSAIWNAVTCIAGDIGTVPLKLYRRTDGQKREETGHALYDLLAHQPTPLITSAAWREASQGHLLLRGNAYTEIEADGRGRITALIMHHPDAVMRDGLVYIVRYNMDERRVPAANMLHLAGPGSNGVDGWSVLKLARESWSLASALEESNARFIANASRPSGFLTTDQPMKPETLRRLKEQWSERNSGMENVGVTPVLDGGFTWQRVGLTAEDSQFLETRVFTLGEIARWFNITPHKLQDLSHATFSNVEELGIAYVRGTLRPWAVRWEQVLNQKLLTERERAQGLYIQFNLEGLLRGDVRSRTEAYRSQFEMGALTPNEIRELEDRNPIDGGDDAYVRLDMAPLTRLEEMQTQEADEPEPAQRAEPVERRAPTMRMELREGFRPLFLDHAQRLVRGEVRDVRRLLTRKADLRDAVRRYYFEDLPEFAQRTMGPIFRAYALQMAQAARAEVGGKYMIDAGTFADLYTENFANSYAARGRYDLQDREAEEIEQRLTVWSDGDQATQAKHLQVSDREVVKLGEAIARQAFVAAGILTLVWRAVGDTCPYCRGLDGRVISSQSLFAGPGNAVEGEGTDDVLRPSGSVGHPPLHAGCNCIVSPGI